MFDVGFSELMVIALVALIVIGPERLPRVARTAGHLLGRLQRYVNDVKSDINREMDAADLGKVKTEFETAARSFQTEMESKAAEVTRDVNDTQAALEKAFADTPAAEAAAPEPPPPSAPEPAAERSPQLELGIEEPAQPGPRPAG